MLEEKNLPEFAQKALSAKNQFSIRDMDGELSWFARHAARECQAHLLGEK